jgi:multidrug efflux pump subunit AcrB
MPRFARALQPALSRAIPGAYLDVQELQTNGPRYPIEIFVNGRAESSLAVGDDQSDIDTVRKIANDVANILRAVPDSRRVRNDWFGESMVSRLQIDPDRANFAGVTNSDVAASTTAALTGTSVATLLEGDKQISVVARLLRPERASVEALGNLYVYPSGEGQTYPAEINFNSQIWA